MQYTQDYDERYPISTYSYGPTTPDPSQPVGKYTVDKSNFTSSPKHWYSWMDVVQPYVKSVQLFDCPSVTDHTHGSYGYNIAFTGRANGDIDASQSGYNVAPIALSQLSRSSEVIMITEWNSVDLNIETYPQYLAGRGATTPAEVAPHLDGGNQLYADGHVKWMNQSIILGYPTAYTKCDQSASAATQAGITWCNKNWNPFIP